MRLRIVAVIWAAICVWVAGDAAIQMLVTFAPTQGQSPDNAAAELAGIERARSYFITSDWAATALLVVNVVLVLWLVWRRQAVVTRP
jgi:hypothetical protein